MSGRIKLKNMLAEAFQYNVNTEKNQFESEVAGGTEAAKKKFEDSMKEKVVGKRVKIRASRGQPGQPEKDYTIDKVTQASIDWYYKQYVVVFTDEKNKEYFLKPGFKVDVLDAAGQPGQPGQTQTQQTPTEPPAQATMPSPVAPGTRNPAKPPTGAPTQARPAPAPKRPVAEEMFSEENDNIEKSYAAEKMSDVLWDFFTAEKQKETAGNPTKLIMTYIKEVKQISEPTGDNDDVSSSRWVLEIPIEDLLPETDERDLRLAVSTGLRTSAGFGREYTRGYADIQKLGRLYRINVDYYMGTDA